MGVKQFNASYNKQEDRMVFRFNTHDDQEFVLWLTRFITQAMITAVDELLQKKFEQKHNPQIAEVIKEFQREGIEKTTKTNETYSGATHFPLGQEPLLVTALSFTLANDVFMLDLRLLDQKKISIQLPVPATQKMIVLLKKLAAQAHWGLEELTAAVGAKPSQESLTQPSGKLH